MCDNSISGSSMPSNNSEPSPVTCLVCKKEFVPTIANQKVCDNCNHFCPKCGGIKSNNSILCTQCYNETYPENKATTICPKCGGRKTHPAKVCWNCFVKEKGPAFGKKKLCPFCHNEIPPERRHHKYCSDHCYYMGTHYDKCPLCGGPRSLKTFKCKNCHIKTNHPPRLCAHCENSFIPTTTNQIYCNKKCCALHCNYDKCPLCGKQKTKGAPACRDCSILIRKTPPYKNDPNLSKEPEIPKETPVKEPEKIPEEPLTEDTIHKRLRELNDEELHTLMTKCPCNNHPPCNICKIIYIIIKERDRKKQEELSIKYWGDILNHKDTTSQA